MRAQRDIELRCEIYRVWHENFCAYGVRKIWKQLNASTSRGALHGAAADARFGVARGSARQGIQDDGLGRGDVAARGPGQSSVYGRASEPTVGGGLHVCRHVAGAGVRGLRHRCVLSHDVIWSNRYVAGSGWSTATSIQTGSGPASTPEVAVDMDGNALAVWRQSDLARVSIWANRYVAGRGWGAASLIESDSSGDASAPKVVLNSGGNALVVWPQIDRLNRVHLWANRYSAVSGWGQVTLVQDDVGTAPLISVAPNTNGSNLMSWSDSAGIWARYVD